MNVLYVGCGYDTDCSWMPPDATVTRLDIDPECEPDIVADMQDLGSIGPFDMVLSLHSLEHLYPHQVPRVVSEFHRVLDDAGYVVCLVPDAEDVRPTEDVLFDSPAGPITGLDILYGHRAALELRPYMAHHNAFTETTLEQTFAGFRNVTTHRLKDYNLLAVARK